jgi:amino acid transporter
LIDAGTSISAFGITVGMLAMTPRYLAALGDETGFGEALGRLSARAVPVRAFGVTWLIVCVISALGALSAGLGELFTLTSLAVVIQYGATAGALAILSWRKRHGLAPRDGWPVPLALVACVVIMAGAKPIEALLVAGAASVGFAARFVRRGRSTRPASIASETRP